MDYEYNILLEIPFENKYNIKVFDSQTNLLFSKENVTGDFFQSLKDELQPGVYFVNIVSENYSYTGKLVICSNSN